MQKLQASKAHRWAKVNGCTGYTRFSSVHPKEVSEVTEEGIAAHEVAASMFNTVEDFTGRTMSNGVMVTPEMNRDCAAYVEYVMNHVGELDTLIVEERLESTLPDVTPIVDAAVFTQNGLHIFEFKYGYTVVEAQDNPQMFLGADAVCKKYGIVPEYIEFHVVQPRGFHRDGVRRTYVHGAGEMYDFMVIAAKMQKEHTNGGVCRTGEHCKGCDGLLQCEAALNNTMAFLDYVDAPEPMERTGVEVGREYQLLQAIAKRLEGRIKALEQEVSYRTSKGEQTGYTFIEKQNPLKWNDTDKVMKFAQAFGLDIYKPRDIITPKQALDRGLFDQSAIDNLASRSSSQKLIYDDQNKEAKRRFQK